MGNDSKGAKGYWAIGCKGIFGQRCIGPKEYLGKGSLDQRFIGPKGQRRVGRVLLLLHYFFKISWPRRITSLAGRIF